MSGILQKESKIITVGVFTFYFWNGHASVQLKVYDILGREVAVLVNEEKPAGIYKVTFDAKTSQVESTFTV